MKTKTLGWAFVGFALILLAVVGMFTLGGNNAGALSVSGTDEQGNPVVTLDSGTCEIAPTVSVNVRDEKAKTTTLSVGTVYRVNGEYFDTIPTLTKGDSVEVLANASGYLDVIGSAESLDCGANRISLETKAYTAPTVEFKEDSSVLTDSATGGAVNGSAVSAGSSEVFKFTVKGTDKKTTGDAVLIVEVGSEDNVSMVNIYDSTGTSLEAVENVPSIYTESLSNSYTQAYVLPAVEGAVEMEYNMNIVADSGDTISGAVYVTAYVGEAYADSDTGEFVEFGVEDSEDVDVSEATWDYDFFLD